MKATILLQFYAIFIWKLVKIVCWCPLDDWHPFLRGILDLPLALHNVPNRVILLSVTHSILLINIWKVKFYLIKCWSDIQQYISPQIKVKLWKKDYKQLACFLLHFADLPHFFCFEQRLLRWFTSWRYYYLHLSVLSRELSPQIKVKLWKKDYKQLACFLLHFADLPHIFCFWAKNAQVIHLLKVQLPASVCVEQRIVSPNQS